MLNPRTRQRLVAWMAMVALWLTIVAPVVSRTIDSGSDAQAGMSAQCMHHDAGGRQPAPMEHPLEKCGYCGLLAGHSLLPGAAAPPAAPPPVEGPPLPLPVVVVRAADRHLAAAPRGPPALSHA